MLLIKYNRKADLTTLLKINQRKGNISFKDMVQILTETEVAHSAISLPCDMLMQATYPLIASVKNEFGNHFVLIYSYRNNRILVADPATSYLKWMPISRFAATFQEKAIMIEQNRARSKRMYWHWIFSIMSYLELLFVISIMIILSSFFTQSNLSNLLILFCAISTGQIILHICRSKLLIYLARKYNLKEKSLLIKKITHVKEEDYFTKSTLLSRLTDFDMVRNYYLEYSLMRNGDLFIAFGVALSLLIFNFWLSLLTIIATILLISLYHCIRQKHEIMAKDHLIATNKFEHAVIKNNADEAEDQFLKMLNLDHRSNVLSHRLSICSIGIKILLNVGLLGLTVAKVIGIEDYFVFMTLLEFYLMPLSRLLRSMFLSREVALAKGRVKALDYLT